MTFDDRYLFTFTDATERVSEGGAHEAVDDEVEGGVEHHQVPGQAVHKPPELRDMVVTAPVATLQDVGDDEDLVEREGEPGQVGQHEDRDDRHHYHRHARVTSNISFCYLIASVQRDQPEVVGPVGGPLPDPGDDDEVEAGEEDEGHHAGGHEGMENLVDDPTLTIMRKILLC